MTPTEDRVYKISYDLLVERAVARGMSLADAKGYAVRVAGRIVDQYTHNRVR